MRRFTDNSFPKRVNKKQYIATSQDKKRVKAMRLREIAEEQKAIDAEYEL